MEIENKKKLTLLFDQFVENNKLSKISSDDQILENKPLIKEFHDSVIMSLEDLLPEEYASENQQKTCDDILESVDRVAKLNHVLGWMDCFSAIWKTLHNEEQFYEPKAFYHTNDDEV
tara:strand:- start:1073 stop:1423 length:351 start_codon:yes stop_codon:yes gene_type:complete